MRKRFSTAYISQCAIRGFKMKINWIFFQFYSAFIYWGRGRNIEINGSSIGGEVNVDLQYKKLNLKFFIKFISYLQHTSNSMLIFIFNPHWKLLCSGYSIALEIFRGLNFNSINHTCWVVLLQTNNQHFNKYTCCDISANKPKASFATCYNFKFQHHKVMHSWKSFKKLNFHEKFSEAAEKFHS